MLLVQVQPREQHNNQKRAKIITMENDKPQKGRPARGKGQVDQALREHRVIELRAKGYSFQQIADQEHYANASAASKAFKSGMGKLIKPVADEVRTLELERLDKFLLALWDKIEQGDPIAIDRGLKIMDRRAKYLGLDAPIKQQVEVTTFEGGSELDREVARLAQILADTASSGVTGTVDTPASTTVTD